MESSRTCQCGNYSQAQNVLYRLECAKLDPEPEDHSENGKDGQLEQYVKDEVQTRREVCDRGSDTQHTNDQDQQRKEHNDGEGG